jgi:hypothetical protein
MQVQTKEQAVSDNAAPRYFNSALIPTLAAGSALLAVLGINCWSRWRFVCRK